MANAPSPIAFSIYATTTLVVLALVIMYAEELENVEVRRAFAIVLTAPLPPGLLDWTLVFFPVVQTLPWLAGACVARSVASLLLVRWVFSESLEGRWSVLRYAWIVMYQVISATATHNGIVRCAMQLKTQLSPVRTGMATLFAPIVPGWTMFEMQPVVECQESGVEMSMYPLSTACFWTVTHTILLVYFLARLVRTKKTYASEIVDM